MTGSPRLSERLTLLLALPDSAARALAARALYDELQAETLPHVESDRAWFVYHGDASQVAVIGDWTRWQEAAPMERIDGTDLFWRSVEFPPTARLQYKFVVDGAMVADPGNDRVSREGFGVNSEFWMPGYRDESWLTPASDPIERGTVSAHVFASRILGERRRMFLYTPAGAGHQSLPLLTVHDGSEALVIGEFHRILDHLIAAGRIPPTAAIFIPPVQRNNEYALNMRYAEFTVREACPRAVRIWRRRGVGITTEPGRRCVVGASLGGLLATATALRWPEAFGACIAQSPAYWWNRGEIFSLPELQNASRLRVVLQTGTISDALELTRLMYQRLKLAHADVSYHEAAMGHTWGNWRTNLAKAVMDLYR